MLQHVPPRTISLSRERKTLPIYIDGRCDSSKKHIGGIIFTPDGQHNEYFSSPVSVNTLDALEDRSTQINAIEMIGVVVAIETWAEYVRGNNIILFIDNNTALSACIKGYSKAADISAMAGNMWLAMAKFQVCVYFARVNTKLNPADAPSREEPGFSKQFDAVLVDAKFPAGMEDGLFEPGAWP